MSRNQQNIDRKLGLMRKLEADYSCSMCSAKWLQSTITLHTGRTHSCCHSPSHQVPLDELAANPSALHNTNHKKAVRAQLLAGEKPDDCIYCWNFEDRSGAMSQRYFRSTNLEWSQPYLSRIDEAGADGDIVPSYIEVAFDNTCNFKCAYCSPELSSKWMEEIVRHGPYPTSGQTGHVADDRAPIPNREANPYIAAFWRWFPTIKDKLQVLRLTGGEPLLSKHTWRVIDEIDNPQMTFAINTNMGVQDDIITRLIDAYHRLRVNKFLLYTSAEATGAQAEYIRFGMDYPRFIGNVRRYLSETSGTVTFMVTFNALSVTTFEDFLQMICDLRREFPNRVLMTINPLRWPVFQDVRVLPRDLRDAAAERFQNFVQENAKSRHPWGFLLEEIGMVRDLANYMAQELPTIERDRHDFAAFYSEYDRRRGTDFRATFPALTEML